MKSIKDIGKHLAGLKDLTPKQLRERYVELYGEPSRSGNRQWLVRRCAWRIQELAEGGLSERAERRARQLARDRDLRVIPPKDLTMDPLDRPVEVQQPARRYIRRTHDARLLRQRPRRCSEGAGVIIKIGAKVVAHSRYVVFQMAEVAVPKRLFRAILDRIRRLRLPETVPG